MMKIKKGKLQKNIIILIIITTGMLFFSFYNDLTNNISNNQFDDEFKTKQLKSAGTWVLSPFVIDNTGGGDYTWAEAVLEDWCSGSGTFSDPYRIENVTVNGGGVSTCIDILNSDVYFIIENCICYNSGVGTGPFLHAGIRFYNVSNAKLINNNCSNNGWSGIRIYYDCDNNTVIGNIANNNPDLGIYLRDGCNDNKIINNTCNDNNQWGIELYIDCDDNYITRNIVKSNDKVGIQINSGCDNNLIYNNSLIANVQSNAKDDATTNSWDNGQLGNYWSDYGGADADDDGIGDTPYSVTGSGGSQDNYPIYEDGDDLDPIISIITPHDNSIYDTSAPNFELTIDEYYLVSAWYTVDGSPNIFFQGNEGVINQTLWEVLLDGPVSLTFYVNDSVGRIASDSVEVRKDTTIPNINLISPLPNQLFNGAPTSFIVEINDLNLDSMWYSIDNGQTNISFTSNGTINQSYWSSQVDGPIILTFYANDTLGHLNSTQVLIYKDSIGPIISITSPTSDQLFSEISPSFIVNTYDLNLDTVWYTIDNGFSNFTFTTNGTIDQTTWNAQPDGPVTIIFYANDTLGQINSTQVIIYKDTTNPIIDIISPMPDQYFGLNSPDFIIEIDDLNLDSMWYTIDGGVTNITFSGNGTIDQNNWTAHPDGLVTLTFYANDTLGHLNSSQVVINKLTQAITINIVTPTTDQLFNSNAPDFTIETSGGNADTLWYTIDGGLNNFTFASNETINQFSWNSMSDGTITIKFYANDTLGIVYSAEISVIKDTEAPIISIIDPSLNDVFEFAPAYEISIIESNLDTIWYTLDSGESNFTVSGLTGIVNQGLWDNLPNGYITIRFYANDTLGHLNFDEVIIVKQVPTPSPQTPGIPGYDLFILFGIVSIVSVIIIKSKSQKQN